MPTPGLVVIYKWFVVQNHSFTSYLCKKVNELCGGQEKIFRIHMIRMTLYFPKCLYPHHIKKRYIFVFLYLANYSGRKGGVFCYHYLYQASSWTMLLLFYINRFTEHIHILYEISYACFIYYMKTVQFDEGN